MSQGLFDFSKLHLEDPIDKQKAEEQIEKALEFDKVDTMDENDKQAIYTAIFVDKCVTNESLFFNSKCGALQKHLNSLGYFILEGKLDTLENEMKEAASAASSEAPISKETQIDYEQHIEEAKNILSKLTKYYEKNKSALGTKTIDFMKFRTDIAKAEAALQDPSRTTASLKAMLEDLKAKVATLESEQTECELLIATKEKEKTGAAKTKAEAEVASATKALAEANEAVKTLTTSSPELEAANATLKAAEEVLAKATTDEAKVKPTKPKAKAKAQAAVEKANRDVLAAKQEVARLTSLLGAELEKAKERVKEAQGNLAKATGILANANELHAAAEEKVTTRAGLHTAATAKKTAATEAAAAAAVAVAASAAAAAAKAAEAKAAAEAAAAANKPKVYDDNSVIQNLTSDNLMVLKLWAFLTRADEKVIEYGATTFPAISKELRALVSKYTRIIPGKSPEKIIAEQKADIADAVLAILANPAITLDVAGMIIKADAIWAAYCTTKREGGETAEKDAKLQVESTTTMSPEFRKGIDYDKVLEEKKSDYIKALVANSKLKLRYTGSATDWITIAGPANANTIGTLRTDIAKGIEAQIKILLNELPTLTDLDNVDTYKADVTKKIPAILNKAIENANAPVANTYLVTIRIKKGYLDMFLKANGLVSPILSTTIPIPPITPPIPGLTIAWTDPSKMDSITVTQTGDDGTKRETKLKVGSRIDIDYGYKQSLPGGMVGNKFSAQITSIGIPPTEIKYKKFKDGSRTELDGPETVFDLAKNPTITPLPSM